jgi:hypothetical protein
MPADPHRSLYATMSNANPFADVQWSADVNSLRSFPRHATTSARHCPPMRRPARFAMIDEKVDTYFEGETMSELEIPRGQTRSFDFPSGTIGDAFISTTCKRDD